MSTLLDDLKSKFCEVKIESKKLMELFSVGKLSGFVSLGSAFVSTLTFSFASRINRCDELSANSE
jgi:hypothetical protein